MAKVDKDDPKTTGKSSRPDEQTQRDTGKAHTAASAKAAKAAKEAGGKQAAAGADDDSIYATIPKDDMEIPHPDGLNLGEYSEHLYEVAKLKGIAGEGGWSGLTLALVKSNIRDFAERGELWLPPEDWVPAPRDASRFSRIFVNTTTGLALNKDALTGRVMVKRCLPNSPALKLGIQPGTFLVSVNGVRIPDKHHQEIKMIIRRAQRPVRIEFSTVWPPRSEQTFFSRVFTETTIGLALNMDTNSRTIVTRCLPNTPAFRRDIPTGVYVVGKHFKEVQKMCKDAERPLKIDFSTIPPAKKGERPPKPVEEAVANLGIVAEAPEPETKAATASPAPATTPSKEVDDDE